MDAYAADHNNRINVLVLNIEGVDAARSFAQPVAHALHGGITDKEQLRPFSLAYIPHHVVVDKQGTVVVNYADFSFEHPALQP